jgi:hypothetical protein
VRNHLVAGPCDDIVVTDRSTEVANSAELSGVSLINQCLSYTLLACAEPNPYRLLSRAYTWWVLRAEEELFATFERMTTIRVGLSLAHPNQKLFGDELLLLPSLGARTPISCQKWLQVERRQN